MLTYLDSCILIYFYEHSGSFHNQAKQRLTQLSDQGDRVVVSDLVRLECRVKPLKTLDVARLAAFDGFFMHPDVQCVSMTRSVFDKATVIRARHNFKLADSLHLAAAIEAGCSMFLTNDTRLSVYSDIQIDVLT